MKYKKCYLIVAVAILIFSGLASAQIEVSPSTIELDLIGGDTVTKQVVITWTGEATVVGFIETEITPDGEGITVTYSENPVILYPNTPKTIDMIINVAINIVPDNYTIDTVVLTEIEEIIKYKARTAYKTVTVENLTRINELILLIQQLQEKINQTTNYTALLPLITILQDAFNELATAIEDALDEESEPEPKKQYNFFAIILFCILITILNLCIFFYHLRVLKLKNKGKENEKNK